MRIHALVRSSVNLVVGYSAGWRSIHIALSSRYLDVFLRCGVVTILFTPASRNNCAGHYQNKLSSIYTFPLWIQIPLPWGMRFLFGGTFFGWCLGGRGSRWGPRVISNLVEQNSWLLVPVENGWKSLRVVENGWKWSKMVESGRKSLKMVRVRIHVWVCRHVSSVVVVVHAEVYVWVSDLSEQNRWLLKPVEKWLKMVENGWKWLKMVRNNY